ncbi:Uncharacterized protein HZ326_4090 [Fusarium oxysporum f. sp. albedinis]|nr:Uncharacterized protein HZ326_4090 [Fusarium oxysporum f. sp. albedinis]
MKEIAACSRSAEVCFACLPLDAQLRGSRVGDNIHPNPKCLCSLPHAKKKLGPSHPPTSRLSGLPFP